VVIIEFGSLSNLLYQKPESLKIPGKSNFFDCQFSLSSLLARTSPRNFGSVHNGRTGRVDCCIVVIMTTEADRLLLIIEASLCSRREIALLRIRCLAPISSSDVRMEGVEESQYLPMHTGDGLAALFFPMLSHAVSHFFETTKQLLIGLPGELMGVDDDSEHPADFQWALRQMCRLLRIYHQWVRLDPILAEELARQGAHRALIQLMQYAFPLEPQFGSSEMIQDCIQDVQDLAGTIAGESRPSFPILSMQPFSVSDLQTRLPLKFDFTSRAVAPPTQPSTELVPIQNEVTILIHQITVRQSAQVDVGFGTNYY
jgi:hypothetical protein